MRSQNIIYIMYQIYIFILFSNILNSLIHKFLTQGGAIFHSLRQNLPLKPSMLLLLSHFSRVRLCATP